MEGHPVVVSPAWERRRRSKRQSAPTVVASGVQSPPGHKACGCASPRSVEQDWVCSRPVPLPWGSASLSMRGHARGGNDEGGRQTHLCSAGGGASSMACAALWWVVVLHSPMTVPETVLGWSIMQRRRRNWVGCNGARGAEVFWSYGNINGASMAIAMGEGNHRA